MDIRQRWRIALRGYPGHYVPEVAGHINGMGSLLLCHALIWTGWRIRALDAPAVYGGPFLAVVARLLRSGRACGLPDDVRAMLSSNRVLRGRTLLVRATADGTPRR